ncbi:MAG TPA: response regulator transcription factor [Pseudonocardiaceae bacterium]|nr:response regulator transcription factor [Pseudonocardiaceae bacterium]
MEVLVVAAEATVAEKLLRDMRRYGYRSCHVDTGEKALAEYPRADLVLLDLDLPDLDGLEVCRSIRACCDIPIIMVTDRDAELDRVLGLQAGSDDYVTRPYGVRELIARIEALMRRVHATERPPTLSHGQLSIDCGTRQVQLGEQFVNITRKEFELLHLLISESDRVVPREQIMERVWPDCTRDASRTIDTHVNSLRHKLGGKSWITTVRGVGFRIGSG